MKKLDLSGQKFTRLTVVKEAGRSNKGQVLWLCSCECAGTKLATSYGLRSGNIKSCGCLLREQIARHVRTLNAKKKEDAVKNFPVRFFSKVLKTDSCWIWQSSTNHAGYGRMNYKGIIEKAHRLSYLIHFGEIPNGAHVLHKCDNRLCVNPEHLFLGNQQINMQDKFDKGRSQFGADAPRAKINEAQAIAILLDNRPYSKIATEYNLTTSAVSAIKCHRTWKHLKNISA